MPEFKKEGRGFKMKGFSAFTQKDDDKNKKNYVDTVRVSDKYKVGDYVSEDDLEDSFSKKGVDPKNYPQLSVQDYSEVKKDNKGKYVTRIPVKY